MKKVLIIAYYFPPKGGSGVQRTTKFAKYLQKLGYEVYVLTVNEESQGLIDYSMLNEIQGLKIYRTHIDESNLLNKFMSKFNKKKSDSSSVNISEESEFSKIKSRITKAIRTKLKNLFLNFYLLMNIPDDKKGWIKYAVNEADKIITENDIDLIFSTSAPYSSHLIAYELANKHNIKWIADFRDAWVTNPIANYKFPLKGFYSKLEKKIVYRADKILSVSDPIIEDFRRRYEKHYSKFQLITNGYDEEDFINLNLNKRSEKFTILYNGTLYGSENPNCFLQALDNLITTNKINKNEVLLKFNGRIGYDQYKVISSYSTKYPDLISINSFQEHKDCIKEFEDAYALLLVLPEGVGTEGIFSGKIFEYIRAGRTILGVVPNGVAKDLILSTQTGFVASPLSISENEDMILKSYCEFVSGKRSLTPNWNKVKEYSRENLTNVLASIIEELVH